MLRNDEVDWPTLHQRIASGEFHNIVISPGPGTPERPGDIGIKWRIEGLNGLAMGDIGWCKEPFTSPSTRVMLHTP